ncbi:MAG TPA: YggS family pyridoxal phosphate-dependent enzyme [Candidatus Eisenbacteria bacterium]|nr:YggS family pyridoxal phosphate-dependent enzyme [Candidatus Eisenbacteria bacterium]
MGDVAANYRAILERIEEAARRAGRDPKEVKLLAAAKSQDVGRVRSAIAAGVKLIGENYVQEARAKKARLETAAEWHMIGHLQRNKARLALEIFDVIESLDGLQLARELDQLGQRKGVKVRTFVEVNLAGERTKSGIPGTEVDAFLGAIANLPAISVEGLMTVPPLQQDPEKARPYFRALRALQLRARELGIPNAPVRELSMGMTADYEVAVEEGATIVRIGTALFGPRNR